MKQAFILGTIFAVSTTVNGVALPQFDHIQDTIEDIQDAGPEKPVVDCSAFENNPGNGNGETGMTPPECQDIYHGGGGKDVTKCKGCDPKWENADDFCKRGELKNFEDAESFMRDRLLDWRFAEFLNSDDFMDGKGYGWVDKLAAVVKPDFERTYGELCSKTSSNCNPTHVTGNNDCKTNFDHALDYSSKERPAKIVQTAYWVFRSVEGFHDTIKLFKEKINTETTKLLGEVPTIVNTFDVDFDTSDNALGWLMAALNIAISGFGPIKGIGGNSTFGLVAEAVGHAVDDSIEEAPPITDKISEQLSLAYGNAMDSFDSILSTAVGRNKDESQYSYLGSATGANLGSPIANFYANGVWLMDKEESGFTKVAENMATNLRRKVVAEVLKHKGWVLYLDDGFRSREHCYGKDLGRKWLKLDGKDYCARLILRASRGKSFYNEITYDIVKDMHSYKIDNFEQYFRAIFDCAKNGGKRKELKWKEIGTADVPRCFYNLPVYHKVGKEDCNTKVCSSAVAEMFPHDD